MFPVFEVENNSVDKFCHNLKVLWLGFDYNEYYYRGLDVGVKF